MKQAETKRVSEPGNARPPAGRRASRLQSRGWNVAAALTLGFALATVVLAACSGGDGEDSPELPSWWGQDARGGGGAQPDTNTPVRDGRLDDASRVRRAEDGNPCESGADCLGGACLADPEWPDGYCTAIGCARATDCGAASFCGSIDGERTCLATCNGDGACRDGYRCTRVGSGQRVCMPGAPPTGLHDGEPCAANSDCRGGTCLSDPEWPDGYCTTLHCVGLTDCALDDIVENRCLVQQTTNQCVRICRSPDACRPGYLCQPIGAAGGFCAPDNRVPLPESVDFDDYPFKIECGHSSTGGSLELTFTIADGTTTYMVTPLTRDGALLTPLELQLPDGDTINLWREYEFMLAPSILFGFLNPLVVPAVPEMRDRLQVGEHTLLVQTDSSDVCLYLLERSTSGSRIDLNLYFAGVPGLDASTAPDDSRIAAAIDQASELFAQIDVTIGDIRYFDADAGGAIIRSMGDAEALVATSVLVGDTVDHALTVNVFFVLGFAFPDGSSTIGISMGLPGAAGLHGTRSSGVVSTSEYLGLSLADGTDGSRFTGVVLAHEIGHFLGLFHTSEMGGVGFDPLADTPECRSGFPFGCPDLDNLMFPFGDSRTMRLTADQGFQLRANPLVR